MKSILINASYAPSLIAFRGELITALIERGYTVHTSAPAYPEDVAQQIRTMGASVNQVALSRNGVNPLADVRYAFELWRVIRQLRPDFVLGYTAKPNIWGSIVAQLLHISSASMVTGLGFSFSNSGGWVKRQVQALSQKLYAVATRFNDHVVFQNPDDLSDFLAAGCLRDASKAFIVNGSGVDLTKYPVTPLAPGAVFLIIARFLGAKGLREFAEAALALKAFRPECRFLVVGFPDDGVDGIPQAELDEWFRAGLEYLGHLADVKPAIEASSVYVLPSYREGTPRTVLEAMAMGRPVITTDAPGCRETVIHGVNGLLVPPRDAGALREAMEFMAVNPDRRAEMGGASFAVARDKYDVNAVNASLIERLGL